MVSFHLLEFFWLFLAQSSFEKSFLNHSAHNICSVLRIVKSYNTAYVVGTTLQKRFRKGDNNAKDDACCKLDAVAAPTADGTVT
jgi:hypothetical protein